MTAILMTLVGLINIAPLVAVASRSRVESMYAVKVSTAELKILLRHRAVLFGIVGALVIAGAFVEPLRLAAMIAGLVSMASFIAVAIQVGGYGKAIQRVIRADIVGLLLLAAATVTQ